MLGDLTGSFLEGLAEDNDLAARGYSRDHRPDCKQIVLALVVTPDGFPLDHEVLAGNTSDAVAFPVIVETMAARFGTARRVWVLDRGIATEANLAFWHAHGQSFLVGTSRSPLSEFEAELATRDWQEVRQHVEVRSVQRGDQTYVLARSKDRRAKERSIRRRQLLGLHGELKRLAASVTAGRLKNADQVQQRWGRLAERWPMGWRFVQVEVQRQTPTGPATRVRWTYRRQKLRAASAGDGAYVLLSDPANWTPEQLWTTYMQLARAEAAFRAMKSHLLLRPMWHQSSGRIQAHVFVCVLAYALWKALDHLLGQAGAMTRIHKAPERRESVAPQDRRMSPAAALRLLHDVLIGDLLLKTREGRTLRLRRVARPNAEPAELRAGLKLTLPERICADRELPENPAAPPEPGSVT